MRKLNTASISMGLDLIEDLIDSGLSEDEAIERTAAFLDALLPLDTMLPAPYGAVAETADGPAFELMLTYAWKWVKNSDERKTRRNERRQERMEQKARRRSVKEQQGAIRAKPRG